MCENTAEICGWALVALLVMFIVYQNKISTNDRVTDVQVQAIIKSCESKNLSTHIENDAFNSKVYCEVK